MTAYQVHIKVILTSALLGTVFLALALAGFHQPRPHGIPLGVVAPAPIARQIAVEFGAHVPGGFNLKSLPSELEARGAINRRQVDAALVVSPTGLRLLTAEAGGTAPTEAITHAVTILASETRQPLTTSDVVPPRPDDSQALSSYFLILCVLFPSLAVGVAAGHFLPGASFRSRIALLTAFAAVAGFATAGVADGISGLGHYWALAGIVALSSLAVSAPTAAAARLKPQLVALAVLAFLILGIPVSGGPANLAAFGPRFERWLHPGLPLGVAVDSIRNTVYFHAADTAAPIVVLAVYALAGVVLLAALALRGSRLRRTQATPDPIMVTPSHVSRPSTSLIAASGALRNLVMVR